VEHPPEMLFEWKNHTNKLENMGKSSMNGSFNLGKFIEINGGFFSKPGLMAPEGSTYSEEMPHWGIVINN